MLTKQCIFIKRKLCIYELNNSVYYKIVPLKLQFERGHANMFSPDTLKALVSICIIKFFDVAKLQFVKAKNVAQQWHF